MIESQLQFDFDAPATKKPREQTNASSETRREAYESTNIVRDAQRIALFLASRREHGATRYEIHVQLGIKYSTVCGRVHDLLEAKRIYSSDQRRQTDTGSNAVVLISNEF